MNVGIRGIGISVAQTKILDEREAKFDSMIHLLKKLTSIPSRIPIVKSPSRLESRGSRRCVGKIEFLAKVTRWLRAGGLDRIVETKRRSEPCRERDFTPSSPGSGNQSDSANTRANLQWVFARKFAPHRCGGGRGSARGCFSI